MRTGSWWKKNPIWLLLSLALALWVLVATLYGLARMAKAASASPGAEVAHDTERCGSSYHPAGAPICEQTLNLVPNPDFESGIKALDYWTGIGECLFAGYEPGHNSTAAAFISATVATKKGCSLVTPIDEMVVEPGRYYDYSAWMKADLPEGAGTYLAITFWKFFGTWRPVGEPTQTISITNTDGGWVQISGSVQAPEGAEYARVGAVLGDWSVGSLYVDDVFVGLSTCLVVSVEQVPDLAEPGQLLTYTVVYSNVGRETATNLQIVETYDKDVQPRPELSQPPPEISNNVWRLDRLRPGLCDTIEVVVRVQQEAQNRSVLFNKVEAVSEEVATPVVVETSTPLSTPKQCAVYIAPDAKTRSGVPGQQVRYSLELYNAGAYGGQASLKALSSLGWSYEIDPPTSHLPVHTSKPVTLTLNVPSLAPAGVHDLTTITATLFCEPPDSQEYATAETLRTSIAVPVWLPLSLKGFHSGDPWEIEPNDTLEDATGPLYPNVEVYGYPDDERDVFLLDLSVAGRLVIDLAIDSGSGIQLQLLDQHGDLIDNLFAYEPPYHLEYVAAPGRYYIGIWVTSDHNQEQPYTLRVALQ